MLELQQAEQYNCVNPVSPAEKRCFNLLFLLMLHVVRMVVMLCICLETVWIFKYYFMMFPSYFFKRDQLILAIADTGTILFLQSFLQQCPSPAFRVADQAGVHPCWHLVGQVPKL